MQSQELTTAWVRGKLAAGPLLNLYAEAEREGHPTAAVQAAVRALGVVRALRGWQLPTPTAAPYTAPTVATHVSAPVIRAAPTPTPRAARQLPRPTAEIFAARRLDVERARAGAPVRIAAQSASPVPQRITPAGDIFAARRQQTQSAREVA